MTSVVVSLPATMREIQARKFGSVTTADTDYALTAGAATLVLDPSGVTWCWVFTEHGPGVVRTRFCVVPDVASVAYADLVDVDPGTLLTVDEPADPAWVAGLSAKANASTVVALAGDVDELSATALRGVAQATAPDPSAGLWFDTSSPILLPTKYRRDSLTGPLTNYGIALGGDPLPNSLSLFRNGLFTAYTLTSRTLVAPSIISGDVVEIQYVYPGEQAAGAAAWVAPKARDGFTRGDTATVIGSAEIGGDWVTSGAGAVWGISSNQAYLATPGGSSNAAATLDCGTADVAVSAKMAVVDANGGPGLCLRSVDSDNCYTTNNVGLFRRQAGANTQVIAFSQAIVGGDTLQVVAKGTTITAYRQVASTGAMVLIGSATGQTFNQTATRHGMRSRTVSTGRVDDFLVLDAP